jgi:hypothetical protein
MIGSAASRAPAHSPASRPSQPAFPWEYPSHPTHRNHERHLGRSTHSGSASRLTPAHARGVPRRASGLTIGGWAHAILARRGARGQDDDSGEPAGRQRDRRPASRV